MIIIEDEDNIEENWENDGDKTNLNIFCTFSINTPHLGQIHTYLMFFT